MEIIRYAAERQVEIIPEIDIPAHSNAALASYRNIASGEWKTLLEYYLVLVERMQK